MHITGSNACKPAGGVIFIVECRGKLLLFTQHSGWNVCCFTLVKSSVNQGLQISCK